MGVGRINPTHISKAEKLLQELFGFVLFVPRRDLLGWNLLRDRSA